MAAKARAFQLACRSKVVGDCANRQIPCAGSVRSYATQGGLGDGASNTIRSKRRAITVTTDDGRYDWAELSTGEKAARTTQQSFNFVFVGAGLVGTITVAYLLYTELFAADSKTRQFNHAVDKVKEDPKCRELLGPKNEITAYGEPTSNKWARARPLAYSSTVDKQGTTHFKMHFHMSGPGGSGVVNVHMTKRPEQDNLEYKLLSLTVPGHPTMYLENRDAKNPSTVRKMFGIQWK